MATINARKSQRRYLCVDILVRLDGPSSSATVCASIRSFGSTGSGTGAEYEPCCRLSTVSAASTCRRLTTHLPRGTSAMPSRAALTDAELDARRPAKVRQVVVCKEQQGTQMVTVDRELKHVLTRLRHRQKVGREGQRHV